jgi:hypothetical protein
MSYLSGRQTDEADLGFLKSSDDEIADAINFSSRFGGRAAA